MSPAERTKHVFETSMCTAPYVTLAVLLILRVPTKLSIQDSEIIQVNGFPSAEQASALAQWLQLLPLPVTFVDGSSASLSICL